MSSIVATASAPGYAALSLIRASGTLCGKVFDHLEPRKASLRTYRDIEGHPVDEVVAVFYQQKASYTGEDSLEMTCHGNPLIVKKIVEDLLARGFEMAGPGEFTRRAFENGKLDLTQAEAVAEVIAARSDRALQAANRVLAGQLGQKMAEFSQNLLQILAEVEAYIDFPEEELPPQGPLNQKLHALIEQLQKLQATASAHRITHQGARVAIIGQTNAGKSSLFNTLLGRDRALVSQQKGTTRDYLEADLAIDSFGFVLIDTAGLNDHPEQIEQMGIAQTQDQMLTADIIIWVIDGTQSTPQMPDRLDLSRTLIVANKSDCPHFKLPDLGRPAIATSAQTQQGIVELKQAMVAYLQQHLPSADTLTVSQRHSQSLQQAAEDLAQAQSLIASAAQEELVAHHLHQGLEHIGEIVGKFDNEEVLDHIFSSFCIGK